ncbi:hypothetical protein GJ744_002205 [Endocarpon pusillum]|uniref:Ankyrin repeat protein n=1 Tax=Endocarpon pusillum TaxID=364733 RepID=A0A8H7A8F5_9EURO|nr:hypothetical protein GJ744_002205 [Endocarpon pusillum]
MIQMLLAAGADVNARCGPYCTALHAAIYKGHREITEYLLDNAASPNVMDDFMRTPLHIAVYRQNKAIVSALVHHGADPSIIDGYSRSLTDWAQLDEVLLRKITV